MNVNLGNYGIGTRTFGMNDVPKVEGEKVGGQMSKAESRGFRPSEASSLDILAGSEPVADVPAGELVRDDGLGRLVSSAFNLPPPPMPEFRA